MTSASGLEITLNPDHDLDALRAVYARDGVVQIRNFFPDAVADAIYDILTHHTPWQVVHSDAKGAHQTYRPEAWTSLDPALRKQRLTDVLTRARDGFAYFYSCYPMIDAYLAGQDPHWPLHQLTEFLNSPEMHHLVKTITDEPEVRKLDAQATLYSRGHFLNEHDDTGTKAERRAAYVMGFTKGWRVDWGGQLLFTSGDRIDSGLSPSFNTLNLFRVPRSHVVTQVTNFAGRGRYSVTGWLRVD